MKAFSRQKIISRKKTKKKASKRKVIIKCKKVAAYKNPEYKDVGRKYKKTKPTHPLDYYNKWGGYWNKDYKDYTQQKSKSLTNKEKEHILAQALNTDAGKEALAWSMVEPIRRSIEYEAIGRKFLMIDELQDGVFITHFPIYTGNWVDDEEIVDIIKKFPCDGERYFDMEFEDL